MAKPEFKPNFKLHQIFDDLEKYLTFCSSKGYFFDESDLYSNKSYSFRQFTKYLQGKPVKNNWVTDAKPD